MKERRRFGRVSLVLGLVLVAALLAVSPPVVSADTVEPYVNLYGQRTDVPVGGEVILILSSVNPITSPGDLTIQLTLKVPSGWSVTSSEFCSASAGLPTAVYEINPGTERYISVHILANEPYQGEVIGYMDYYFARQDETKYHKEKSLSVIARKESPPLESAPNHEAVDNKGKPWVILGVFLGIVSAVGYILSRCRQS